ncbi:YueI family protein [Bacillus sp. RG28]|uniref:YueI family protein n=1 Tax=Gottfriedia endophytica TaxID=2820819 RepID=A0A940NL81_9BACI|nr:YueI family protein [Gottfriedia endophytica]MBP0726505.1 YueI family protein [Gottfriedia endophytica]
MAGNNNVDDYIKKGIYGEKQIKVEERNVYLGTIRERIELALTGSQVMKNEIYKEFEKSLSLKGITVLLNGSLPYSALSKYIKLANMKNIPFSLVNNLPTPTPIGLVLTYQYAVDKPEIFVKDDVFNNTVF